jgi:transcriptional regulator with XRE-family HTH domain
MENLRELRTLAGLSQVRLARLARVSRARVSFAECGEVELTEQEQRAILLVICELLRSRAQQISFVLDDTA